VDEVFVDANYYIAVLLDRDRWHVAAIRAHAELARIPLVTTDAVLFEVLNHMSKLGPYARQRAVQLWRRLHADSAVTVMSLDDALVERALRLYERRGDKRYSLTDCGSMVTCSDRGITRVLTHDHNFEQEGLQILIKDAP
jgi:predicted nucleic acid-binding protein